MEAVMARYLNAVLGEEQNIRQRVKMQLDELYKLLAKPELLTGRVEVYTPKDEENGEQLPDKVERVQITATEVWESISGQLVMLFDITARRDFTNSDGADAVADITLDDRVLVEKAPSPYLIWLDRQLDNLKNIADRMPTLPPTSEWSLSDPIRGIYQSEETKVVRQVPGWKSLITAEATDRHPAQTHVYQDTTQVGVWQRRLYSGAMHPAEKARLLDRIVRLQNAVNTARQAANRVEAQDPRPGQALVGYLFTAPVAP